MDREETKRKIGFLCRCLELPRTDKDGLGLAGDIRDCQALTAIDWTDRAAWD
jgi:hypothetical protein